MNLWRPEEQRARKEKGAKGSVDHGRGNVPPAELGINWSLTPISFTAVRS
jgi:hypothetical protein